MTTEGYLSNAELFNGILFILREPNSNGKVADTFWMRDVVNEIAAGRAATKYKNRLTELVEALGRGDELKHSAYVNIHPDSGTAQASECYKKLSKGTKGKIAKTQCENYKAEIVFTCKDIFHDMWKAYGEPPCTEGISYHRGGTDVTLERFQTENMTVFAIYHPSMSPKLPPQDLSEVLDH